MKRAVVCIPVEPPRLLGLIVSSLGKYEIKLFHSVDDGFEHLWSDGKGVGFFVLQLTENHIDELWSTAGHWPQLHFLAVYDDGEKLPLPLNNIMILRSGTPLADHEDRIISFLEG